MSHLEGVATNIHAAYSFFECCHKAFLLVETMDKVDQIQIG